MHKASYSKKKSQREFTYFSLITGILLLILSLNLSAQATENSDSLKLFKLLVTNPKKFSQVDILPLFISSPDSICGVSAKKFIWSDDEGADSLLIKAGNVCGTQIKSKTIKGCSRI